MATILVVDDDPHTRQLYVSLLTSFGHGVIEGRDGQEGLRAAQLQKPDLIISDILMPTMSGYEFVSTVRQSPGLQNLPIIFQSATFLDSETRTLGAACGVSLFISKPSDPEQILGTVNRALGISGMPSVSSSVTSPKADAIPLLLDAFFERGKQLDSLSVRLASLLDFALNTARSHDLKTLLELAGNAARKMVGANYSAIGILRGEGFRLRSFNLFGVNSELASKLATTELEGNIFREIIRERKPRIAFSTFGEPVGLDLPAGHPPIRSFLGVPLTSGDQVYGWIYVADKLGDLEFNEQDAQILTTLSAQAGLAYRNVEAFERVQEHAKKLETQIEERKLAEAALRKSETRVRRLFESNIIGIGIGDLGGKMLEANSAFLSMLAYTSEDLYSGAIRWNKITPPEYHDADQRALEQLRATGATPPAEKELIRKDGKRISVLIGVTALTAEAGDIEAVFFVVDTSDRKRLAEELRQAQKMEAIGRLAGGIAHDFNNLLGVIIGYSELVLDRVAPDEKTSKQVQEIKKASNRAASLTSQLLAFSRQQVLEPKVLNLNDTISDIDKMLRRLIGEDVELQTSLASGLGFVKADPGQIGQIIMNLAVNARDAMPNGGKLIIETSNVELDEEYTLHHEPCAPGQYVLISVTDTGIGMDADTKARIFEPFFTTKEIGKGTGLGLATVYGVVRQSGGHVWVYSELRKGTVFKIYLPRVEQRHPQAQRIEISPAEFRGTETVLLAEDDESLRALTRTFLEQAGYTVLEANNGVNALGLARQYSHAIHLLLSDVVMPEMNGPMLADKLAVIHPETRVLYASGYTGSFLKQKELVGGGEGILQKPYLRETLLRKVHEVLKSQVKLNVPLDVRSPS